MNWRKVLEIIIISICLIFLSFMTYLSFTLDTAVAKVNTAITEVGNEYYQKKDKIKNVIPILVYHHIQNENYFDKFDTRSYSVSKEVFEQQIKYILDMGYTPLTVHDLIIKQNSNTLPKKPIAITFDDGWQGQYTDALPILLKYKVTATFYVYNFVLDKTGFMTLKNIQELNSDGMEIAGHTVHHPHLTQLASSTALSEIVDNKLFLEENLHTTLHDFAYPYGNFNLEIEREVKTAGYESARTSTKTIYNDFSNLYELKSIYASPNLEGLKTILIN